MSSEVLPACKATVKLYTGSTIPLLGFGTWQSSTGEVGKAVEIAIKNGFRHIDTAVAYQNESEVGDAIAKCISEGIVKREELFITTKLWCTHHHPNDVRFACDASLKRLKLDYLDLYLIHWPCSFVDKGKDFNDLSDKALFPFNEKKGIFEQRPVPLTDTWRAMEDLVDARLCRHIGVSNFSIEQLHEITDQCRIMPAAHQIELHPCLPQRELIAEHEKLKIVTQAYSPFGIGEHSIKTSLLKHPTIEKLAQKYNMSAGEMLLRWNLGQGHVTLSKSVTPERIVQNAATTTEPLPSDLMEELNDFGAKNPLRVCNPAGFHGKPEPPFSDGYPSSFEKKATASASDRG